MGSDNTQINFFLTFTGIIHNATKLEHLPNIKKDMDFDKPENYMYVIITLVCSELMGQIIH